MGTSEQALAVQQVEQEVTPVVEQAQAIALAVIDDLGCVRAEEYLLSVQTRKKRAVEILDPFRRAAYDAYQETLTEIKKWTDPLDRARQVVEPVVFSYRRDQERKRQEEARRLQEEEQKRMDDEKLRRAEAAAVAGDAEQADAILDQPTVALKPVLPPVAKTKGVAAVERWSAEVFDLAALVKAAAKDKRLLSCLMADVRVLDSYARAQKGQMNIPGVRAIQTGGMRIGGRAA